MTGTRVVVSVTLLYLVAVGAALLAFLLSRFHALPWYLPVLCASPAAVYALVALRGARDAKQFLGLTVACFAMLPILLLMVGASYEAPRAESKALPAPVHNLDEQRLVKGALAVQDVPVATPGITLMRSALFADGSELRLTRFASVDTATHSLAVQSDALAGRPLSLGPRAGLSLAPGSALIVYVEQHEHELLEVRARSAHDVLARLVAQDVPLPKPVPAAEPRGPQAATVRPVWPFAVGYSLLHVLAFVAFIYWAGARTTRVPARRGVPPVPLATLHARLGSLATHTLPFTLRPLGNDGLAFEQQGPVGRSLSVLLQLDERRAEVRVRELQGASGAAPRDAAEADMRPLGSVGIDPTRPDAQRVWSNTVQTTLLDPKRLASVPVALREGSVSLVGDGGSREPDGLLYLLCAVVTGSGYAWQPVFRFRQRRGVAPR